MPTATRSCGASRTPTSATLTVRLTPFSVGWRLDCLAVVTLAHCFLSGCHLFCHMGNLLCRVEVFSPSLSQGLD